MGKVSTFKSQEDNLNFGQTHVCNPKTVHQFILIPKYSIPVANSKWSTKMEFKTLIEIHQLHLLLH